MASIRKRGDTYTICVCTGRDINGKKLNEYTTFVPDKKKTDKQNQKALDEFVYEFEQRVKNGLVAGDKMTLKAFSEKWLEEYAEKELEETTLAAYKMRLKYNILPNLGHYKLNEIKPLIIKQFLNDMKKDGARVDGKSGGYSNGTVNKMRIILSSIFSSAVEWEYMQSNPCYGNIRSKKCKKVEAKEVQCFSIEQTRIFLECLDKNFHVVIPEHTRKCSDGQVHTIKKCISNKIVSIPLQFKVFFNFAIFGGFRRGELIALTWEDLDFEKNTVSINKSTYYVSGHTENKVPKTSTSIRTVVLPQSVMLLAKQLQDEQLKYILKMGTAWEGERQKNRLCKNYLFTQVNGKQMAIHTPRKKFHEIIKLYNNLQDDKNMHLPFIPLHGLRHTSATLMISQNVDISTVSARLGHAQTSTTLDIYAHALEKLDVTASEALAQVLTRNA